MTNANAETSENGSATASDVSEADEADEASLEEAEDDEADASGDDEVESESRERPDSEGEDPQEENQDGGEEREADSLPDHALEEAAEAIIFAADDPVPPHRIAEIFAEVTGRTQPSIDDVEEAVAHLNEEYDETGRALEIHSWAGGFRMATRSTLSPFVKALFVGESETSLSRSLMETLGVLAYRQPVTRPEVDFIRGVNSDYAIRKLLELGLADVKGRADSLGRPLLYGTTPRFLEQFGLDSLEDLPTLREVRDLLDDPMFDEERAKLLQLDAEQAVKDAQSDEGEDDENDDGENASDSDGDDV